MKKLVLIIILYFVSTVQISELFSQNTTTQLNNKGFFTLDKIGGKWLLISPDLIRNLFFQLVLTILTLQAYVMQRIFIFGKKNTIVVQLSGWLNL